MQREAKMLNDDIIKIIGRGIDEQKLILEQLKNLGHNLTQSGISRKLKQMGIVKIGGKYQLPKQEANEISSVKFIEPNLLVIRTSPGHASAIAAIIDEKLVGNPQYPEFVGTIAGDDTIFVATENHFRGLRNGLIEFLNINLKP